MQRGLRRNSPTPGARGVTQGAEGKGQARSEGGKGKASICSSTWPCSLVALGLSLPLGNMGVAPSKDWQPPSESSLGRSGGRVVVGEGVEGDTRSPSPMGTIKCSYQV